jgi:tetratricopeptide (TPR) repeat protein
MSGTPTIDADDFVQAVTPLLAEQNLGALVELLRSKWTHTQIASLFHSDNADARKVSAFAFGLVGQKCCVNKLAALLKDRDPMVHQMAEHALWSVWLRSGNPEANHQVCRGTKALNRRDFEHALSHFNRAIDLDPTFAEAYNQRAIVHYLGERYEDSIEDCQRTVSRMPCHFGAWAGLGHCFAHLGKPAEAIRSYEKALEINPRLEGVRQGLEELRAKPSGA